MFPQVMWSKSGSLLIREGSASQPHLLFWGDASLVKGMQLATSTDLKNWTLVIPILIIYMLVRRLIK
jgi:hypothetical protein